MGWCCWRRRISYLPGEPDLPVHGECLFCLQLAVQASGAPQAAGAPSGGDAAAVFAKDGVRIELGPECGVDAVAEGAADAAACLLVDVKDVGRHLVSKACEGAATSRKHPATNPQ